MTSTGSMHQMRFKQNSHCHCTSAPIRVFLWLVSHLYDTTGCEEVDKTTVTSIVLQTASKFNFDPIEKQCFLANVLSSPKEALKSLTSHIENINARDDTAIETFLNLLINLERHLNYSEGIRTWILKKFDCRNCIEIVQVANSDTTIYTPVKTHSSEENINPSGTTTPSPEAAPLIISQKSKSIDTEPHYSTKITRTQFIVMATLVLVAITILVGAGINIASGSSIVQSPTNVIVNATESPVISQTQTKNITDDDIVKTTIPSTRQTTEQTPLVLINDVKNTTDKKHRLRFDVPSYKEYNQFMGSIPDGREVIVSIHLENPLSWPNIDVPLQNSDLIRKLSLDGPLPVDNLVNILKQTPNIYHLYLKNTDNKLCERNQGQLSLVKSILSRVYLPVLKKLVLQNFTSCPEVYETMVTTFEDMPELKYFVVHEGIVDDKNHFYIQQLIQKARWSLKHVLFPKSSISTTTPLLETGAGAPLNKVGLLRVDANSVNGATSIIPLGDNISKIFPNLKGFISYYGALQWRNVSNVLKCSNLTKLHVGIEVPQGHYTFSLKFLRKALPLLRVANITLLFQDCGNDGVNSIKQILGWGTVRDTLVNLSVRSNCKFYANFSNVSTQLKALREEKYTRVGSYHVFTYLLLNDRKR